MSIPYSGVIFAEDFNSKFLKENKVSDDIESMGFNLVTDCDKVFIYNQLSMPMFSKHDHIFIIYNVNTDLTATK